MNVYNIKFAIDDTLFGNVDFRYRNILAKNKKEAKIKLFAILKDKRKKINKLLNYYDLDIIEIELLKENIDINLFDNKQLKYEETLLKNLKIKSNSLDAFLIFKEILGE